MDGRPSVHQAACFIFSIYHLKPSVSPPSKGTRSFLQIWKPRPKEADHQTQSTQQQEAALVYESPAVLLQHAASFPTAHGSREAQVTSQSLLPHATPTHTVPSPGENSLKAITSK